jgi:hypothetical protein
MPVERMDGTRDDQQHSYQTAMPRVHVSPQGWIYHPKIDSEPHSHEEGRGANGIKRPYPQVQSHCYYELPYIEAEQARIISVT